MQTQHATPEHKANPEIVLGAVNQFEKAQHAAPEHKADREVEFEAAPQKGNGRPPEHAAPGTRVTLEPPNFTLAAGDLWAPWLIAVAGPSLGRHRRCPLGKKRGFWRLACLKGGETKDYPSMRRHSTRRIRLLLSPPACF